MFMTCSQFVHDLITICSWLVHNLFMTCSWLVLDLFITCLLLYKYLTFWQLLRFELFMTSIWTWHAHDLIITCLRLAHYILRLWLHFFAILRIHLKTSLTLLFLTYYPPYTISLEILYSSISLELVYSHYLTWTTLLNLFHSKYFVWTSLLTLLPP